MFLNLKSIYKLLILKKFRSVDCLISGGKPLYKVTPLCDKAFSLIVSLVCGIHCSIFAHRASSNSFSHWQL